MKGILYTACIAALLIASALPVAADAVEFDFTGSNALANAYQFSTADGLQVTVTGKAAYPGSHPFNAPIHQSTAGLGLYSYGQDSTKLDGKHTDEILWLDFTPGMSIAQLVFGEVDSGDDVRIVAADGSVLGAFNLTQASAIAQSTYLDVSSLNLTDVTRLGVAAIDENDSFRLRGVVGHAVPTPTAACAGLLGLGLTTLRRRTR